MPTADEPPSPREIEVRFYHLVVSVETLDRYHPEQCQAFLDAHPGAAVNDELVVWNAMAEAYLQRAIQHLETLGVPPTEAYVGLFDGLEFIEPATPGYETRLCPWLIGRHADGKLWLRLG